MPLTLHWRAATRLPVEAGGLLPPALAQQPLAEILRRPVPVGNGSAELGELFRAEGESGDGTIVFEFEARTKRGREPSNSRFPTPFCPGPVRGIGRGLASGTIVVRGSAGAELGAGMTGGTIDVEGDVGDYAGAEMRGGLIRVRGSAGRSLGAAYPGGRLGMREGVILVEGSAGNEAGLAMRRGLIAVSGAAGDDLGHGMVAGSIFAFGSVGRRAGAGMKRGTLALLGAEEFEPLPTFAASGRYRPPVLTIYLRRLRDWGFPVPEAAFSGLPERYNGDRVENGQGEILVRRRPG